MSYGSVYPYSWWGIATDGGYGDIYFDLSEQEISEIDAMLDALQNRADNYENEVATKEYLEDLDSCGLLEEATLVLTPTGYSEGVLHSTKPPMSLGEELVTNGSFDTDSGWSKSGGWTISSGKANASLSGNLIQNSVGYTGGGTYELSFTVSNYVSGSMIVRNGNIIFNSTPINSNGDYAITTVASGSYDTILFFNSGSFIGSIDNISVKEVLSADLDYTRTGTTTRTNAEGNVVSVAANVPVINYENGVAGIRIEDGAVLEGGYEELFGSQEGSVFIRCKNLVDDGVRRQLYLIEEGNDDRIVFRFEPISNQVETVIRDNGTGISTLNHIVSDTTQYGNYVVSWENGLHNFYVNGVLVGSNTPSLTGILGINKLKTDNFNGDFEILVTCKRRLTQDEVTCLNSKF